MVLDAEELGTVYGHVCRLTPTEADGFVFRWHPDDPGDPAYEINASREGVLISGLVAPRHGEAVETLCFLLATASAVAVALAAGDVAGARELVRQVGR